MKLCNMKNDLFVQSVKKDDSKNKLHEAIENVLLKSTDNLGWLKKGDKVLLKPALNSPDRYPATTSPDSVEVVYDVLVARGARVIIADQSGIEHVQHSPREIIGSSKKCFLSSGMGKGLEKDFVALETRGWDKGFKHFKNTKTSSWKNGFYMTNIVDVVDHVINLPRVSTHAQAGVTLGFKNFVGMLRQDSRAEFHADGPFFQAFKMYTRKTSQTHDAKNCNKFFEKIVEISEGVRDKLRLTLFVGTRAQVTFGPDRKVMRGFTSKVVMPETGLVFASANQVSAEAFAIAYIKYLYEKYAGSAKLLQKVLVCANGHIKELNQQSVWDNPSITHALKLHYGQKDLNIINIDNNKITKVLTKDLLIK